MADPVMISVNSEHSTLARAYYAAALWTHSSATREQHPPLGVVSKASREDAGKSSPGGHPLNITCAGVAKAVVNNFL